MPRGRHRNPEPLHRLLTPTTVAGVSLTSAGVAWLLAEPLTLRLLVALTAATGVAGAVVMRAWDRSAGRRVAELTRDRVKDEWKTDERIAELESELEEARLLRARLDAKLRAKRVELAGLRGEHAALLRRYATAETERASALEGRRLLAMEAAAAPVPGPAKSPVKPSAASPAGPPSGSTAKSVSGSASGSTAAKEIPPVSEVSDERNAAGAATPVGYARANAALGALARRAERGTPPGDRPGPAGNRPAAPAPAAPAAVAPVAVTPKPTTPAASAPAPAPAAVAPAPVVPRRAAVVAPYAAPRRTASRVEGGFDFFGTKTAPQARSVIEAVQNEDLADVVGAEALAAHKAESDRTVSGPEYKPVTPEHRAVGQVIDLTAHDETEPIDVARLRTAIS